MSHLIFIIIISIMTIGISNGVIAQPYYSQLDLDYESLKSYYEDVPSYEGNSKDFVIEIINIENDEQIKASEITGFITCKVFINETGHLETIFITKSINNYVDSLAIEALKESKFKRLQFKKSGKKTKYSCIVKYHFDERLIYASTVNDIPTAIPDKKFWALTKKPEVIKQGKIEYPELARKAGIEGRIILKILIDTNGNVEKVKVARGHPLLNKAAIKAAYEFKFKPGEQKDKLVRVWMTIPIDFKLKK